MRTMTAKTEIRALRMAWLLLGAVMIFQMIHTLAAEAHADESPQNDSVADSVARLVIRLLGLEDHCSPPEEHDVESPPYPVPTASSQKPSQVPSLRPPAPSTGFTFPPHLVTPSAGPSSIAPSLTLSPTNTARASVSPSLIVAFPTDIPVIVSASPILPLDNPLGDGTIRLNAESETLGVGPEAALILGVGGSVLIVTAFVVQRRKIRQRELLEDHDTNDVRDQNNTTGVTYAADDLISEAVFYGSDGSTIM